MPVACSRCGAPNPDGNNFCQNCGTPLAGGSVATQAGPPPPGYQSPYYAPAQPQQVQRTPWMLAVGIIAGLVVVMGACGVGIAIVVPKSSGSTATGPKLGTPAPPATRVTPSPPARATPSARPSPAQSGSGRTVSTASLSVTVPSGFQIIDENDTEVTVQTPKGDGLIQVQSGRLSNPTTDQQLQQSVLANLKEKYPDADACGSEDSVEINGPTGSIVKICFTLTQQNAAAEPGAAVYWLATNATHNVYYEVDGFTSADSFDDFMDVTSPFVDSVSWKLT